MRNFVRSAFVSAALLLAACSFTSSAPPAEGAGSTAGSVGNPIYEEALRSWVNHPEEDLVNAWGVPERSQRLTDGGQALEYRRVNGDGRLLCTTLFTSDVYGVIRTWSYRGTECRAPQLGDYSHSS